MNSIKISKKIAGTLATLVIVLGLSAGVFASAPVKPACASANPNLTVRYRVANISDSGPWGDSANGNAGDVLQFSMELHNTVVGSSAANPKVQALFTQGTFTNGKSVARFMADNAAEVRDEVGLVLNPAASLAYIPGTTRMNWDLNGDGNPEYNNTPVADGIASSGINLPAGEMKGCNAYIAQVWFLVRVKGEVQPSPSPTPSVVPSPSPSASPTPVPSPSPSATPSPSPSVVPSPSPTPSVVPSPSPVVSPSPSPVGNVVSCPEGFTGQLQGSVIVCVQNVNNNTNNNSNNQSQTQTNNQSVNITNTSVTPAVAGVTTVPLKTPDTGVGVLGLASMFSAAPIGLALTRFGRGRINMKKKEEVELGALAQGLVKGRKENLGA